ncbi:acetyl-CoA carboxylase biotin carboxylase subunit [Aquamicrobium sp. LC103]|uniref:acetyl-CoA carboxylase biotin carboxylase subunit n=1 Tax=Aquamicrobium sp. LC103 TaxID=1120658 RepID=UPI0010C9364A|nr:acetyl-CoA carboxylase biotin carboxylase subunit [Aquamicrobium sp. LC103]TKT76238.1 acetyl-CoA carboxylase biotin carboxylase subunit [Aquamicrobium sp. LC103]
MIGTVLIANRGEVALRVQRACRALGMKAVQAYSQADAEADYVRLADAAICIGPASSSKSYLNIPAVIFAARATGCDAVHPGYGFLSENAEFAEAVEAAGLTFIGPSAQAIRIMGDKISARTAMAAAGVPCIPGSPGALPDDFEQCRGIAATIGYPVIVKAAGGGGGRGMRVAAHEGELAEAVATTREEARAAFSNPAVYIERYLGEPRHVEIQILADAHGNVVWLGERDCSMQRRHQKIIEEAPAPGIPRALVANAADRCVEACRRIGYSGAGTFEFLYEKNELFFIEMNTRLQVEHPVTEAITDIDIVQAQLRIAGGERLWLDQADIEFRGHSLECRINAEDPVTFAPSPGVISNWQPPSGVGIRVDTHIMPGYAIPTHYDSMIAKIVTHGRTRDEAIRRMREALANTRIDGIKTNIPLHREIMVDEAFLAGGASIHYLEAKLERAENG